MPTPEELDAIAAFQESLQTPEHDLGVRTNSPLAKEGEELFFALPADGGAGCAECHIPPLFTDNDFHNNMACVNFGSGPVGRCDPEEDPGRCRIDPSANDCDAGPAFSSFNTPQLRDVRHTAPYFHNNVSADLRAVENFYNGIFFTQSPAAVRLGVFPPGGLGLTDHQVDAIVAFLERM